MRCPPDGDSKGSWSHVSAWVFGSDDVRVNSAV